MLCLASVYCVCLGVSCVIGGWEERRIGWWGVEETRISRRYCSYWVFWGLFFDILDREKKEKKEQRVGRKTGAGQQKNLVENVSKGTCYPLFGTCLGSCNFWSAAGGEMDI